MKQTGSKKLAITIAVFVCCLCVGQAIPGPFMKIKEVSGVVERVVWRGEISYDQSSTGMDGDFVIKKVTSPPSWVLVLKDVKGLDDAQILAITHSFCFREPGVGFSRIAEKDPKLLYLWMGGESSLKIDRGQTVVFSNFVFESDERGGAGSCDKITVKSPVSK